MRKNNGKAQAKRGQKRNAKNKARIKRSTELKDFNNLVGTFKFMQEYMKNARKAQENNADQSTETQS